MSSICIVDTSIFCNILNVPNRAQQRVQTVAQFDIYIRHKYTFLLPMATIYETGNHIAQNGSGQQRRKTAQLFVDQVQQAFTGKAPWTPTPFDNVDDFMVWLDQFPDHAMSSSGIGDLSIIKVFERQCALHPSRHVFIWSNDSHLQAYNREV